MVDHCPKIKMMQIKLEDQNRKCCKFNETKWVNINIWSHWNKGHKNKILRKKKDLSKNQKLTFAIELVRSCKEWAASNDSKNDASSEFSVGFTVTWDSWKPQGATNHMNQHWFKCTLNIKNYTNHTANIL